MSREELFAKYEFVVENTLCKMYGSIPAASGIAKRNGFDLDDLFQVGYSALWRVVLKHDEKHTAFYYFASKAIRFELLTFLRRKGPLIRFPDDKALELKEQYSYNDIDLFEEVLSDEYNVEKYVINKIELEIRMQRLNDIDRRIIDLSLQGYRDKEIGEILNADHRYILTRRTRAIKKMAG